MLTVKCFLCDHEFCLWGWHFPIVMRNEPGRAVMMLCARMYSSDGCGAAVDAGHQRLAQASGALMYHAYLRISIVVGTKIKHFSLFFFVVLFVRPDSVFSVLASCVYVLDEQQKNEETNTLQCY